MLQTVEAVIDAQGRVHLLENIKLGKKHRALVTILSDEENFVPEKSIVGTVEILGDLEEGSKEISRMFNQSIQKSSEELAE